MRISDYYDGNKTIDHKLARRTKKFNEKVARKSKILARRFIKFFERHGPTWIINGTSEIRGLHGSTAVHLTSDFFGMDKIKTVYDKDLAKNACTVANQMLVDRGEKNIYLKVEDDEWRAYHLGYKITCNRK